MTAEGRPKSEDHPARQPGRSRLPRRAAELRPIPSPRRRPGPGQIGYTKGYEADALLHVVSIVHRLPRIRVPVSREAPG